MKCSLDPIRGVARTVGFTLVELLTVVGIMAVLAAILFPVVINSKTTAKKATCLANLHSIGTAFGLYANDNQDTLPNFHAPDPIRYAYVDQFAHYSFCQCHPIADEPFRCWLLATKPYLTLPSLYCPDDASSNRKDGLSSYEYKLEFAYTSDLASIQKPSKVALAWEQWAYHQSGKEGENDTRSWMNILFADGSAKYKSLARATSAVYGDGPDLHFTFKATEADASTQYDGEDFVD